MLLAYAKLTLYDDLLESSVPDDPYLGRELGALFPEASCASAIPTRSSSHRLRREIIATQLANSMINRGGPVVRGAHRRPDRRAPADDRGGVRRRCATATT